MVLQHVKHVLFTIGVAIAMFIATSLFDIVLSVVHARFYSNAAFIVIFGVGGIFAGLFAFSMPNENGKTVEGALRWTATISTVVLGLIFFYPLAALEGGEYEVVFKSFGLMMALSAIFFSRMKF